MDSNEQHTESACPNAKALADLLVVVDDEWVIQPHLPPTQHPFEVLDAEGEIRGAGQTAAAAVADAIAGEIVDLRRRAEEAEGAIRNAKRAFMTLIGGE